MKIIKKLLSTLLLFCIPLSSCVVTDSTSSVVYTDKEVILSSDNDFYQVERGDYLIVKVNASCEDQNASLRITFAIEQSENIIQFISNPINTDGTIQIASKNVGKATVIAKSSANPSCQKAIEIEVVKHIPSLQQVWKNISEFTNYSLNCYRTPIDDEADIEYRNLIEVTDKAILYEEYEWDDSEKRYYLVPLYADNDYYQLGYGIDKNNNAFTILLSSEGEFVSSSSIAKTQRGFLTKDNFTGYKGKTSGINDVGLFYGLQAINPLWLMDAKQANNKYVIDGKKQHTLSYLLWNLVDPMGKLYCINYFGNLKISDITKYLQFEITALSSNDITIKLTYQDLITPIGIENYHYFMDLEDINETSVSNIVGLEEFIDSFIAPYPTLPSELSLFDKAIRQQNYIYSIDWYFRSKNEIISSTLFVYYTEEYFMAYYSSDFKQKYKENTLTNFDIDGFGYLKKKDGIYPFFYYEKYDAKIVLDTMVPNSQNIELWECDYHLAKEYRVPNYFSSSVFFQKQGLHYLSNRPFSILTDIEDVYYTRNEKVFSDVVLWNVGEEIHYDNVITGFRINIDENNLLESVDIYSAFSDETSYYELYSIPHFSDFGKAQEKNLADQYIRKVLED